MPFSPLALRSTSVESIACLEDLVTSGFRPGELAYVESLDAYFKFDPDSVLPADGVNVIEGANCGRWLRTNITTGTGATGSTGGTGATGIENADGVICVDNLEELSQLDTALLGDCALAYVDSVQAFFQLLSIDSSPLPIIDGITAVDGTNGRTWSRLLSIGSLVWTNQRIWYVDSVNGDDENDGATPATAVETLAEVSRRLIEVYYDNGSDPANTEAPSYIVNILSDVPATDSFDWNPKIIPTPGGSVLVYRTENHIENPLLELVGQEIVVIQGPVGTYTASDPATNAQAEMSITGIADFTPYVGLFLETPGLGRSAIALSLGASFRLGSTLTAGAVVIGEVATISSVTAVNIQLPMTGLPAGARIHWRNLRFPASVPRFDVMHHGPVRVFDCIFETPVATGLNARLDLFTSIISLPPLSSQEVNGLFINRGNMFIVLSTLINVALEIGAFQGKAALFGSLVQGGYIRAGQVEPATKTEGHTAASQLIGVVFTGIFDWPENTLATNGNVSFPGIETAAGLIVGRGSDCIIAGFLYGTSLAAGTYGAKFRDGSLTQLEGATIVPTLTGPLGDFLFGPELNVPVGEAIPPLIPGAVVPPSAPLTMWAEWDAPPFERNVMGYSKGTRIHEVL